MNQENENIGDFTSRFRELQDKFRSLEPGIENTDTKKALSVMNGMVQELWRHVDKLSHPSEQGELKLQDVSEMYRNAPRMNGAAINKPLDEGTKAPDFTLPDADGKKVSLSDFRGSPVLLAFYPLDWSPGCSQQLDLYQHEFSEFEKRGVNVLGISVDSIYSHGAWAFVRKIEFPLLSDFNPKGATAIKYNVYREPDGFSERALYLVDGNGIIRYSYVSPYLHHIPDIYTIFQKIDNALKTVKAN
ncbi:MAG TPA: peroxiredoxin [Bacteroidales bacterium]|nr:peroxiredoxin [Bacteroidales bacterium]